jgi:Kef-type K+ transport system membrane component KefB
VKGTSTQNIAIIIESFFAFLNLFIFISSPVRSSINTIPSSDKKEISFMIIAIFCVLVPFTMGFILMKLLGYSTLVAFIVGASFSLTAEATKLKVLLDLNALNTKLGTIMLGAGILDDIFEVIFLAIVIFLVTGNVSEIITFPIKILIFIAIVYITYKLFPLGLRIVQKEHSRISLFSFILIFGIFVSMLSTKLGLGPIIGAFIAGIIIHLSEKEKEEHHETVKELEVMTFSLIIPFFFINIGLHFDYATILNNWGLIVLVIIVGTVSKILGSILATPFTDLKLIQTHLIGWGMNSRGAVELVMAEIARSFGLINIEVYSAIVTMAVVTTLLFPVVFRIIIKNNRKVLN